MASPFDALVIGGGPGGAAAALLLARAGWSVALVERKAFPRRKVCGEYLSGTNLPLLRALGLAECFAESAGPEVRRVGVFARDARPTAALPQPGGRSAAWGRALGRDRLDTLLLEKAAAAGVAVYQPWSAVRLDEADGVFHCGAEAHGRAQTAELAARLVILAHGSWERGRLASQVHAALPRPSDLLAFKAHFRATALPADLMVLLAFPGGYGGMVHADDGRVSLSCCVRRDRLARLRRGIALPAGAAVLEHIRESCRGVRLALDAAVTDGPWLAAGPIRPGIRLGVRRGVFPVGNLAGEAHPVVAEGISMALQSAWLLARRLIAWDRQGGGAAGLEAVGADYARAWRRAFAPRLYTAAALAQWAMRPAAVAAALPLVRRLPALLTWGAQLSGKATQVVPG